MNNYQESFERRAIAARYWLLAMIGSSANAAEYAGALAIMELAAKHHNGKRNGGAPEFVHQVSIFHHIRSFHHLLGHDAPLYYILAFAHDIIEDAQKQPDGLKRFMTFNEISDALLTAGMKIERIEQVVVRLGHLSKEILGQKNPNYSLETIFADKITAVVKLADRCDNISTMMGVFKKERAQRYVKETKEQFVVLAKSARRSFPEHEAIFENMKMFMDAQLRLIELMMPGYTGPVSNVNTQQNDATITGAPQVALKAILAVGPGGAIGYSDGKLLARCSIDMEYFKDQTRGHNVVMGRTTFHTLPGFLRPTSAPLSDRHILVVTGEEALDGKSGVGYEYVYIDKSLTPTQMFDTLKRRMQKTTYMDSLFVAGGGQIYDLVFKNPHLLDEVHISKISADRITSEMENHATVKVGFNSAHTLLDMLKEGTPSTHHWSNQNIFSGPVAMSTAYNNNMFNGTLSINVLTKEML